LSGILYDLVLPEWNNKEVGWVGLLADTRCFQTTIRVNNFFLCLGRLTYGDNFEEKARISFEDLVQLNGERGKRWTAILNCQTYSILFAWF